MSDMRTRRRLAAILAADVVGMSRRMAADESGTLAALRDLWADLFNPAVAAHRGRIVKMMGDGALVEFASAVDAVDCALAVQRTLYGASGPEPLVLRIGINLGDIVIDGEDIFGDGVNVAARLEGVAPQGGILIADAVQAQTVGKVDAEFADTGPLALKNIDRPVRGWRWEPDLASAATESAAPPPVPPDRPSIAVLPFTNMSGDPEQEYFSDGISEDVITDLSKIAGLMVVARNSSFAYKGSSPDIRQVGRDLGVTAVLEGSIRRAGNRVRITAQLIDAVSGGHLWGERFDRDLTDIFAVQDEVTAKIVDVLKVKLRPTERLAAVTGYQPDIRAHDLALRAREISAQIFVATEGHADLIREAVDVLKKAIVIDPGYGVPYSGLGMIYNLELQNAWVGIPDARALSVENAETGVALSPDDAFTHFALAIVRFGTGDAVAMKTEARIALELNPNYAFAYSALGTAEMFTGNPAGALPYFDISMRLDPAYSNQMWHNLGTAHMLAGRYAIAAKKFRERVRLAPATDFSRAFLAACLGQMGEADEARRVWAELRAINPRYDLDTHLARLPWHSPDDPARIREGLARAGLPD